MDTADLVISIVSGIGIAALVGGVIFGVIWAVIYSKKMKEKTAEYIKNLSDEQLDILSNTPYRNLGDPKRPNAVVVKGMVMDMKEKGDKTVFSILFYDRYFPNSDGLTVTDIVKLPNKKVKEMGIRLNGYVDMVLNEDKDPVIINA
ncbi:MAG: rhomboid family intramembrane serine protease [Lachnospiraceae bacterium]|nr:rhomboid family intramembrane serine protease [Lachnospiraceae bacterium]